MDSIHDGKAAYPGLFSVYDQLYLGYQEERTYGRFTRDFSQFLSVAYTNLIESGGVIRVPSFQEWKPTKEYLTDSMFATLGDTITADFPKKIIVPFLNVINGKYLSDIRKRIHNS